jgi:hypothetical protein
MPKRRPKRLFVASLTSPLPACGERSSEARVRGRRRESEQRMAQGAVDILRMLRQRPRPLFPTFSPRAGRRRCADGGERHSSSPRRRLRLDKPSLNEVHLLRISPPYQDAGRVTPAGGASAVPAGRGSSPRLPGGLGKTRPVRHHDRSAGAISLDWDFEARVMPASDAWKPAVGLASCVAMRSVFRTIGTGAPNKSREVAWLELSGGVRSLPQVPWWNAERRARRKARAVP